VIENATVATVDPDGGALTLRARKAHRRLLDGI